MKIQNKLLLTLSFVGLFIVGVTSFIYVQLNYVSTLEDEKNHLKQSVMESAIIVQTELKDKLFITKSFATAPIIENELLKSNTLFESLNVDDRKNKVDELNKKWKEERKSDTPFIKSYMNNDLALFLKKQQKTLPNVYGEIFITNRYGSVVATTGKLSTHAHYHKYWWKESFNNETGKVFFDDRGFDKSVGDYVVGVVIPIKKDGKIIGILKSNVYILAALGKVIESYNSLKHGKLQVVRSQGLIVADEDAKPLSKRVNKNIVSHLKSLDAGVDLINDDQTLLAYSPIILYEMNENIGFGSKPTAEGHILGNLGELWHTVILLDIEDSLFLSRDTKNMVVYIGLVLIIIVLVFSYVIAKLIAQPIIKLEETVNQVAQGDLDIRMQVDSSDEVGKFASSFNEMLDRLQETTSSRDELFNEVKKREVAEQKVIEREEIMLAQSRLAAMGDMLNMIAHQWRQPISIIAMKANTIIADIELEAVDNDTFKKLAQEINIKTQELSSIIDDFRGYFKQDTELTSIMISKVLEDVLSVVGKSLENNSVDIEINIPDDIEINTYKSELLQVIINILKNAKEILVQREIVNKRIIIDVTRDDNHLKIKICDNAGGINQEDLDKIFEPYFSTKKSPNETGLGLFTSKMIIKKHLNGDIKAYNENNKACFEIIHPLNHMEVANNV